MIPTPERSARAALTAVVEPGLRNIMQRVVAAGAEATWRAIRHGDGKLDRTGRLARLAAGVDGARVLACAAEAGIRFVCPGDDEWPVALDCMSDTLDTQDAVPPPLGLYIRGSSLTAATKQAVTVVGSRAASKYGERVAADLSAELATLGWAVVSGAAFGIDAAAHRGSLALGGATAAVLACGVDVPYPRAHAALLDRIAEQGAVVSELPPGVTPTRSRFLARNRVIATLTGGTVVVEAAARSGALSTARWAGKLSRPVMAVPGAVTSSLSEGCHNLIREGNILVTSAAEVIDAVGQLGTDALAPRVLPAGLLDLVSLEAREVFEDMPPRFAITLDELVEQTGRNRAEVDAALAELDNAGLICDGLDGWRIRRGGA